MHGDNGTNVYHYLGTAVKLSASGTVYMPFGRNPAVAGKRGGRGWPGKFLIFIVLRDDKSIPDPRSEGTIKDNPQRPRAHARVLLPDELCDSAARIHFREAITPRKTIVNFSFLSSDHVAIARNAWPKIFPRRYETMASSLTSVLRFYFV